MLKRFYSKKSGFTLVEIVIAFAIFAIMASMIMQMLRLAVNARHNNDEFQAKLESQERVLSLVEKDKGMYANPEASIELSFNNGTKMTIPADRLSTVLDTGDGNYNDGEGLNVFVSPIDYKASGEGAGYVPGAGDADAETPEGGAEGDTNTGSQASRMDTRLTGSSNFEDIQIHYVVKDTHTYTGADKEVPVPVGCTRYYFWITAMDGYTGAWPLPKGTMAAEDVAYAQFRLYFYDNNKLDGAESAVLYTDEKGNKYTKDVFARADVVNAGLLKKKIDFTAFATDGLKTTDIQEKYDEDGDYNRYTVEKTNSNCVKIASPYETRTEYTEIYHNEYYVEKGEKTMNGIRFNNTINIYFYVDLKNIDGQEVEINEYSFGANAVKGALDTSAKYTACPMYNGYNEDGTFTYPNNIDVLDKFINIYGAYMPTRHYTGEVAGESAE